LSLAATVSAKAVETRISSYASVPFIVIVAIAIVIVVAITSSSSTAAAHASVKRYDAQQPDGLWIPLRVARGVRRPVARIEERTKRLAGSSQAGQSALTQAVGFAAELEISGEAVKFLSNSVFSDCYCFESNAEAVDCDPKSP